MPMDKLVVPTYVGVILKGVSVSGGATCGPHVCGGDPDYIGSAIAITVWSPRMWG